MYKIIIVIGIALTLMSCGNSNDKPTAVTTIQKEQPQDPLEMSVKRGKEIYSELCITCHLPSGKGVAGAFPPLNPSNWLTDKRTESIRAVKYGLKGEIIVNGDTYDSVMLPLGLDNDEVADVMNYTIQTWNKGEMVTVEEVASVEKE